MGGRIRLQCQWYVILFMMIVFGVFLVWSNPTISVQMSRIFPRIDQSAWSRLAGIYLLAIAIGHLVVFFACRGIHTLLNLSTEDSLADLWSPELVGICERVMYPTALLMGYAEFIGVWLAVKVAGQWIRWGNDPIIIQPSSPDLGALNAGRRRFNRFLVGNALSIMMGTATWAVLKATVVVQ